MKLTIDYDNIKNYHSKSQLARFFSELWVQDNLYCPACTSKYLERLKANTILIDFTCPDCNAKYQLKSKSKSFSNSVSNGAYEPKIRLLNQGVAPHWIFMEYNKDAIPWRVKNLYIIGAHFITPEMILCRKHLSDNAKRKGWIGSTILLDRLPYDAKIFFIKNDLELPTETVRNSFKKYLFLKEMNFESKGWINDILSYIKKINKIEFTLDEIYQYENELSNLHPNNLHVKEKIRQQLQILRDYKILEFIDRGKYRINI